MPRDLVPHRPGDRDESGFPQPLATPSGVVHAVWDQREAVTPLGPLVYFAHFLQASGLWEEALRTCPLRYASPNSPRIAEVLGTLLLTVLTGGRRFLHASAVRCDPVVTEVLGMRRVLSHESVRRAIARDGRESMLDWLREQLLVAVGPVLDRPWVLDEDVTSRVVYGTQEGAVVGYNGKKPGHPSFALHTYTIAGLRLVLDVQVRPGNETSGAHGHDGLIALIAALPEQRRPALVRGDIAYGFEDHMAGLENLGVDYLFKIRRSDGVKQLIAEASMRQDWRDAGKGWQAVDTRLRLTSWSRERRAIVLRRAETRRPAIVLGRRRLREAPIEGVQEAFLAPPPTSDGFEYAVIVTSLGRPIDHVAQLYRDRADSENINDELKNHWGWGGFTTDDLDRTAIMARFTALAYDWWTLYARRLMPGRHTEAHVARPLLMTGVGQMVRHGGQRLVRLTGIAQGASAIAGRLTATARRLAAWMATAAQLAALERWARLAKHLLDDIEAACAASTAPLSTAAVATNRGI